MVYETYGDIINMLIRDKIFFIKKCKYCGHENYFRRFSFDYIYCQKCGEPQEANIKQ